LQEKATNSSPHSLRERAARRWLTGRSLPGSSRLPKSNFRGRQTAAGVCNPAAQE